VLLTVVTLIVTIPLWLHVLRDAIDASRNGTPNTFNYTGGYATTFIGTMIYFVYSMVLHKRWGQTIGKRALGIRVVGLNGQPLSWGQAAGRAAIWTFPKLLPSGLGALGGLFRLLDGLWPLWDKPYRQALHDKAVKTIVVKA
jgi:uncharacterized RDD family membrane protein YckC